MSRVLIADKMSARALEVFKARGIEAEEKPGLSPSELEDIIGDFDGLAVRSATRVTAGLIAKATRLTVVGRAGIGVDNIDLAAASQRGIVVMNTPFGNSITTAEHTIAMLLASVRQIPDANASTMAGKWEKSKFMGVEVSGKTLGIIGCGNIGSIVADRAQGLKMKVMAYDPFLTRERAEDLGVKKVHLDTLLGVSDFISLHVPLTDSTRGIINEAAIAKMKDGVRIVNCARGGLIDEKALKKALEDGKVASVALDVFEKEPATDNPLFGTPNVIATPHLGAATSEAQVNVAIQVAEQISDYLLTGEVTNALNMPSVSAEDAPKLMPYMALAKQVGSLAGQVTESGIREVTIEYEGQVAELNTRPITSVVLEWLLKPLLDQVNMVSAPILAKDRNIDVNEVLRDRAGDYNTLMRLIVRTEKRTRSVTGTLFSNQEPRIVNLNGIEIEAELSPRMLFVSNEDKPGLIGALGMILADAKINIATFNLGRRKEGDDALALVAVDQPLPKEVLEKVADLSQVRQVKVLNF